MPSVRKPSISSLLPSCLHIKNKNNEWHRTARVSKEWFGPACGNRRLYFKCESAEGQERWLFLSDLYRRCIRVSHHEKPLLPKNKNKQMYTKPPSLFTRVYFFFLVKINIVSLKNSLATCLNTWWTMTWGCCSGKCFFKWEDRGWKVRLKIYRKFGKRWAHPSRQSCKAHGPWLRRTKPVRSGRTAPQKVNLAKVVCYTSRDHLSIRRALH